MEWSVGQSQSPVEQSWQELFKDSIIELELSFLAVKEVFLTIKDQIKLKEVCINIGCLYK